MAGLDNNGFMPTEDLNEVSAVQLNALTHLLWGIVRKFRINKNIFEDN